MTDLTPLLMGLILAGLAFLLVTCVLGTLAWQIKTQCERHDLVVEARRRRQNYLDKLKDAANDQDVKVA